MLGIATKLYLEKERSLPVIQSKWPLLEKLETLGYFHYVDLALADKFTTSEVTAAFICFLSLAKRGGHLCIKLSEDSLIPAPLDLYCKQNAEDPIPLDQLQQLIIQGAKSLPDALATRVDESTREVPSTLLCISGSHYYFQRYWLYETQFLSSFRRLLGDRPQIAFSDMSEKTTNLLIQKRVLPEQAEAILKAADESLTIISGGPGTGKTYTAGQLIRMVWESLPETQRDQYQIALAAPTGKAAANLQESLLRAVGNLPHFKPIAAKTLHSLLGIRGDGTKREDAPEILPYDLVIVDECSMVDVQMMVHLFSAVKPASRLILLGDRHQLPPVEAGSLFADIMNYCPERSVELITCMRTESEAIVDLASAINKGQIEEVKGLLDRAEGVSRVEPPSKESLMQKALLDAVLPLYASLQHTIDHSPQQALHLFQTFRILSPLRKGPFGVDELNPLIVRHLMKLMKQAPFFAAPIMIASNDAQLELFNGESGVLIRKSGWQEGDLFCREGDFALFSNKADEANPVRVIPALLLAKYEYAYCLSVHKSQGSEYDRVLFLMPPGTEYFGREVFYTAATRARKSLEIWGTVDTIALTLRKQSRRLSGIV